MKHPASIGRLAVLLAAATLSPLATGQTIPEVAPEIVSAWKANGENAIVIFLYDGTYYMAQDSATEPGMERGTFTWEKATSAFSATTMVDTNGESGLSHPNGTTTLTISGNTMTYTVSGEGSFTFSRVVNTANTIVGSWFLPGEQSTVTFLADGTYYNTEEENDAPNNHDGMEYGTYVWNSATGILTANATTDTNGETGLSNLPVGLTATISANVLTATDSGGSTDLRRITPIPSPLNVQNDFEVDKFANYEQDSSSPPSLLPVPVVSDYPFSGEAYIGATVAGTGGTLTIAAQSARSFDADFGEWFIETEYPSLAALDASSAFPNGANYVFARTGGSATLSFPAGGTFPPAPKIVGEGEHGAWSEEGRYLLGQSQTLIWDAHTAYDPSTLVTVLSVVDQDSGEELLYETVIQGDITSYDFSGKLTPGGSYDVQLEHVKIASSTTAGTGPFAGKLGYALYNSNTRFTMVAPDEPGFPPVISQQPLSRLAETGDDIILSVAADAWPAPAYQWYKDGVELPGQTGNSLSLFNFDISNRGAYTVTATNYEGAKTSSTAWLSGPPVVEFVIVGKEIDYVQTDALTVVVNPQPASLPDYGGPYGFGANVEGQNMQLLAAPTVTPPAGTPASFYSTLSLDEWDQPEWSYGPDANDWEELTQPLLDARFPNGTYTFSVSGVSVPLTLTGDAYPNTPQLTLSGGTWKNGKYAMDAANPLTVTTNTFTGYGSNVDGHIGLWINDVGVEYFENSSPSTNFATYTAPPNTLPTDQAIEIEAGFDAIVNKSIAIPDAYCAAVYSKYVDVEVHILPKIISQTPSQTVSTGNEIFLDVTATGTPASSSYSMNYQWSKGGTPLEGEIESYLYLPDFQAADAGSYTCTVTNDVGTVTTQPIILSLPDAFSDFLSDYGLNPSTTGAPGFDFDKDGVPTLLEYLFGTNPTLPGGNSLPSVTKAPGSNNVAFTYKRKLAATGVTQVVEHSTSLSSTWTAAVHGQNGVTISTSSVDAATELVTVTIPSTTTSRFVRLKATR